jgi:ABC-type transport system involved in cytochrome bd biosynthesis fused ATPase/permease subunit
MSKGDMQKAISVLFQNYIKPSMSLREAVSYSSGDSDLERINHAINQGQLDVEMFPNGIDTQLTKNFDRDGIIPSGGQWQKIALARMFYRNTGVFILDEPSAALDPQAEDEVFRLINEMKGEKTILFITHRLASVLSSDTVIYLDETGKAHQNTHEELMKENEKYKKLYLTQANKYKN